MNNKLIEVVKKRNLHPKAYKKLNNVYVIDDGNKKYVFKLDTNNYDIYKYLVSRDFLFFPENYSYIDDDFDLSLYIDGLNISDVQKINDYIKIIAILHHKTSYNRQIDLDEIKEKYESFSNQVNNLRKYYLALNEEMEHELFLSPSKYLLLRNISLIYQILDNIENIINDVYSSIKNEKSMRFSLIHNNTDLEHLIINKENYLISWDKAYFDSPIIEINSIFRKYYEKIDLADLLKIYENINKLTILEKKILLIYLGIPKEITMTNDIYLDTKIINNELKYLNKVYELLIKDKNEK